MIGFFKLETMRGLEIPGPRFFFRLSVIGKWHGRDARANAVRMPALPGAPRWIFANQNDNLKA